MEYKKTFAKYSLKIIFRDGILSVLILAPIITGLAFKIAIPSLDKIISSRFQMISILEPYYLLIDTVLAYLSPCFFSIISSLVILEEIDENTSKHLMITPIGKRGYLIWRLYIPCILAFILSLILLYIFNLSNLKLIQILLISAISAINAMIMALIVITTSRNKVEGLAWTKLVNLNIIFLFIPFFYEGMYKIIFSVFPAYWITLIAKNFDKEYFLKHLLFAIIILSIWFGYFHKKFFKKVFY